MVDMVRQLKHLRGSRRLVLPVKLPGRAGRGMAGGGLLPTGAGPRGHQSLSDWLRDTAPASSDNGTHA